MAKDAGGGMWGSWMCASGLVYRILFLGMLVWAWFITTDSVEKSGALVGAMAFGLIETCWTSLFIDDKFSLHMGHTTFAQFWANILYCPVLLFTYKRWVQSKYLRVLLYPLNIWLLELVVGYSLTFLFGRNIAWFYPEGDARFDGNIRLKYAVVWWALGVVIELAWLYLIQLANELEPHHAKIIAASIPITLICDRFLPWPKFGIPPPAHVSAKRKHH
mmetsp:Transcript_37560/g.61067  ORF Transcript_37560/g.61067 Transcript_37560/m.61067 type:complete len:218 (+) Transcript_37560:94-747(+)